jgi:DNA-binding transcriptional LysR family regulator
MGIGILPVYTAIRGLEDGSLVRVLPHYTLQKMNIYALNPSRHYTDARVKTWIEFLRRHMPAVIARDNAALLNISAITQPLREA